MVGPSLTKRCIIIAFAWIQYMSTKTTTDCVTAATLDAGGAAGVKSEKWFVAIVNNNTEKAVAERLLQLGHNCYVATQKELRIWRNGRRKFIDRVVVTSTVFIKCSEQERRQIVCYPFINRFMTNRAANSENGLRKPPAVIPERQMEVLQFMLGNSDNPVTISANYRKGDSVRVVRGSLRGLEGEIISHDDGSNELVVMLDVLGCARVTIDPIDVEKI